MEGFHVRHNSLVRIAEIFLSYKLEVECKSGRALISNSSSSALNCAGASSGGRATRKENPYFSGNPFVCRLKLIPVGQLVRRLGRVGGKDRIQGPVPLEPKG